MIRLLYRTAISVLSHLQADRYVARARRCGPFAAAVHQHRAHDPDHDAEVRLLRAAVARLEREALTAPERSELAHLLAEIERYDPQGRDPGSARLASGLRKALGMSATAIATAPVKHAPHCHATIPTDERPDGGCVCGAWRIP